MCVYVSECVCVSQHGCASVSQHVSVRPSLDRRGVSAVVFRTQLHVCAFVNISLAALDRVIVLFFIYFIPGLLESKCRAAERTPQQM